MSSLWAGAAHVSDLWFSLWFQSILCNPCFAFKNLPFRADKMTQYVKVLVMHPGDLSDSQKPQKDRQEPQDPIMAFVPVVFLSCSYLGGP